MNLSGSLVSVRVCPAWHPVCTEQPVPLGLFAMGPVVHSGARSKPGQAPVHSFTGMNNKSNEIEMPGTLVSKIGFPNGREFVVVIYDILYEPVDCIVNAANSGLSHGRGVAGTVSGQVTDASGRPVAMGLVSAGGRSDITDVHGRFRLMGVPDGQQRLQVRKNNAVTEVEVMVGTNTTQHVTLP